MTVLYISKQKVYEILIKKSNEILCKSSYL